MITKHGHYWARLIKAYDHNPEGDLEPVLIDSKGWVYRIGSEEVWAQDRFKDITPINAEVM
jgi:hypothetical protein